MGDGVIYYIIAYYRYYLVLVTMELLMFNTLHVLILHIIFKHTL